MKTNMEIKNVFLNMDKDGSGIAIWLFLLKLIVLNFFWDHS